MTVAGKRTPVRDGKVGSCQVKRERNGCGRRYAGDCSKRDQLPQSLCRERLAARRLTGWTVGGCLIVALHFVYRCRFEQGRRTLPMRNSNRPREHYKARLKRRRNEARRFIAR